MVDGPVLREPGTCWRRAQAPRFAVIVDAEDYYTHVQAAILEARHSIMLIGWDFDTRIALIREGRDPIGAKIATFWDI